MNVSLERRRLDADAELLAQEPREGVDEMIRALVAVMNERILALDRFHVRRVLRERREMRIVLPQAGARRAHVREEALRTSRVQIPHRRREHHEVARGLGVAEDEFLHGAFDGTTQISDFLVFSTKGLTVFRASSLDLVNRVISAISNESRAGPC